MTRAPRRTPTAWCSSSTARSSKSCEAPPGRACSRSWAGSAVEMLKVSLRNLLVSKLRLFLTVAAVTLGVAFVSGTFVLSDTMAKAFDGLYAGLTSGTDVVVKSKPAFDANVTTNGGQVRPIKQA